MQDTPSQPQTPQAPSMSDQINQYIQSLPSIVSAQAQYGPQMEANNLAIQKQYAPQYQALQDSLNPELARLRKSITEQAYTGSQDGGMPDYMRNQYLDQFRAEVGGNNGSGIGADYVSRAMLNQANQYKMQNQNLGLSLIGAQPLYQAQQASANASNIGQGYNAGSALNYGASTYGNYVGAYSNMYGTNGSILNNNNNLTQQYAQMAMRGVGAKLGFPG